MSRVLENDAKTLLRRFGATVPASLVIDRPAQIAQCEATLGYPVVVKALVPGGRKMKSGAVRIVHGRAELKQAVEELLGAIVNNYSANRLLIEQFVQCEHEVFLSISYDALRRVPRLLLGTNGGIDVEESHRGGNRQFAQVLVDPITGFRDTLVHDAWKRAGLEPSWLNSVTDATRAAWQMWNDCEALFLEVNPVGLTPGGQTCMLGALLRLDDDALFRHPELTPLTDPGNERSWQQMSARERRVLAVDAEEPYRGTVRYTDMPDGDIGNCGAGGGGSLVTYDLLKRYGLQPANYGEFGGNPSAAKVYGLISTILSKPGVSGLLINSPITNNTRTDEVARGTVRALQERHIDPREFPLVVRMAGVNDREATRILDEAGYSHLGEEATMEDAVASLANLVRQRSKAELTP